jgi:hypothetical protein
MPRLAISLMVTLQPQATGAGWFRCLVLMLGSLFKVPTG